MTRFLRFPTVFYIEPTNDCNLSCAMCPRKKSKKKVGYMSLDLFRDVVDQLSRQNVGRLSLHLTGEPLLHPQIMEMVRYAKGSGLPYVRFATNATLLNEDVASELVESGLDSVTLSMDSVSAKKYCPGQKEEEILERLDENILRLIELKNKRDLGFPEVHAQIIKMKSTENLICDFVEKWKNVADRVTVKDLLSWSGHTKIPEKPSSHRLICINHLSQGVVLWDGDVSFCCLYVDSQGDSSGILGNVTSASLEDIFLGERRREIIQAQLKGDYDMVPYCKGCPDWKDFLGWMDKEEEGDL